MGLRNRYKCGEIGPKQGLCRIDLFAIIFLTNIVFLFARKLMTTIKNSGAATNII